MSKFKVGDKVVPISKSTCGELRHSSAWRRAERNQHFLYVTKFREYQGETTVVCDSSPSSDSGDFFLEKDLIPYVEFKEGDYVYISDTSNEQALSLKEKRLFVCKVKNVFICCKEGTTEIDPDDVKLVAWKYAVPIPPQITFISMKLNDSLNSEVFKDKIVVGCQTISSEKVEEVLENMKILSK